MSASAVLNRVKLQPVAVQGAAFCCLGGARPSAISLVGARETAACGAPRASSWGLDRSQSLCQGFEASRA